MAILSLLHDMNQHQHFTTSENLLSLFGDKVRKAVNFSFSQFCKKQCRSVLNLITASAHCKQAQKEMEV
jgi:hypothetical protein